VTPRGRTEVPLPELLGLLEQLEEHRHEDDGARRRSLEYYASETGELPERWRSIGYSRGVTIAVIVLRSFSLAYHRLVAERLDERLVAQARRRLERWRANGSIHPQWAAQWERTLSMSVSEIAQA
jgi:hypothetical protein